MKKRFHISPLTWRNIHLGSDFALAIPLFLMMDFSDSPFCVTLSFVILIIYAAILASGLIFWRCPNCHRLLPYERVWSVSSCPSCGEHLYY